MSRAEYDLVLQRSIEGPPKGKFDLKHLQAIHHHLFQDVYDWAGKLRTVGIAKGGNHFLPCAYIERGMADVHHRLKDLKFLRGRTALAFADLAGRIMGDLNYIHPFREGNGRTQLWYLKQLAAQAGHPIDLTRLDPGRWIAASRQVHEGRHGLMAEEIAGAIGPAEPNTG